MDKEDRATFLELFDMALNSLDNEDLTFDEQTEIRERWIQLMKKLLLSPSEAS
jgi:hypothetical protein